MIEQALYEHLISWASLAAYLTKYNGKPAVFNQEAPPDSDDLWGPGPQYCRVVFYVDVQGDPERAVGGILAVDIQCKNGDAPPEELEPIVRDAIHGWFFTDGKFIAEAQWKSSNYFTQPTDEVKGCTIMFDLLAFPFISTGSPDVVKRINEWTAQFEGIYVINQDQLPASAWRPEGTESAVYWRVVTDTSATWIPDTFQTIWRTAQLKGHVFSASFQVMADLARDLVFQLYTDKRLMKSGESPIMVNQQNRAEYGADPLRTGQISVDATYGVLVYHGPDKFLQRFEIEEEGSPVGHDIIE